MTDRRWFISASLAAAFTSVPHSARGQSSEKTPRVCILMFSPAQRERVYEPLVAALRTLGWEHGKNLVAEPVTAEGRHDRFDSAVAECMRLKADVLVTVTTPGALAAKKASATIPIVSLSADPVATGIVASLARPGGNVTGVTDVGPGLVVKLLDLLREAVPTLSRVTVLSDAGDPVVQPQLRELETAARSVGVRVTNRSVRTQADLISAMRTAVKDGDQALITTRQSIFSDARKQITGFAIEHRLPAISPFEAFAPAGGFLSYAPHGGALWQSMANQVDKILRGAKPADLPVERPNRFDLRVNLRTAKALRIAVPQSLLLRADHIID